MNAAVARIFAEVTARPPVIAVFPHLEGYWYASATDPNTGRRYYGLSAALWHRIGDEWALHHGAPLLDALRADVRIAAPGSRVMVFAGEHDLLAHCTIELRMMPMPGKQ